MVNTIKQDKFIKYMHNPSKVEKLVNYLKKIANQKTKSQKYQIGIKSYKAKLINNQSKNSRYMYKKKIKNIANISKALLKALSKTSSKTSSKISKKASSKASSKAKSKTSKKAKSKTSKKASRKSKINNITKLIYKKYKIIQPNSINIPNMEIITQPITNNSSNGLGDKYVIAIPSYKRSDIIQTHTLAVLNRYNIKPEYITIFVANQEEYDIYIKALPKFLYNNIVIGLIGLKNQRNFINEYYPEGKFVVEMDDDIKNIMQLVVKRNSSKVSKSTKSTKKTVKHIEDLDAFIRRAFEMCIESNIFLWGVYPLVNPYFMSYKVTTDLRFIVGPMWGMINRHRNDLKLTIDEKENSERTLQFWVADGAVLRFNNIGIETKYYKNKGGMQEEGKDRKEEALKSVYYLHKIYPTLTKISLTKKNGMPEIKMDRKRK